MKTQVLGEALHEALGDRTVTSLLFCTHDLEPQFFEQEVLPVFIGNDLKHNRRTREFQLDYAIREQDVSIDVFYEPRALADFEGSARLRWGRHKMEGRRGGKFHPKVVLALCVDDGGRESLLVCVTSANLTASSWWRNVECADVTLIEDQERHSYTTGLLRMLEKLARKRSKFTPAPTALKAITAFVRRQESYERRTWRGHLRPQLLGADNDLLEELWQMLGDRITDCHLEIVSPFFDEDPDSVIATLDTFIEWFAPRTVKLALPARQLRSSISEALYEAVLEHPTVAWASLPAPLLATSAQDDVASRGVHAKVYRFWRGGAEPLEVLVVGSHNMTSAALAGDRNWESSVVVETQNRRPVPLLENTSRRPAHFRCADEDLESEEESVQVPLSVAFDWATETGTAQWDKASPPTPVDLRRVGTTICRIELAASQTPTPLSTAQNSALRDLLLRSSVVTARRADGHEGPLLIEELNHDHKPHLLEGVELTASEIFELWSIPSLREQLRRRGGVRAASDSDEDDLEHAAEALAQQPSMFELFSGVFHAFASLRTRVDAAMEDGRLGRAGRSMYVEHFDSPVAALRLVRQDSEDPVVAYVTYGSARLLDAYVSRTYPDLADQFRAGRKQLLDELRHERDLRRRIIEESDDPEMDEFLTWFDRHFAKGPT
jgi:hypothetical protein